jgi:hypothetical protein
MLLLLAVSCQMTVYTKLFTPSICLSRVKTLTARLRVGTVCLRVRSIRRAGKAGIAVG